MYDTVAGEDKSDVLDAVEMLLKCVMERLILLCFMFFVIVSLSNQLVVIH